MGLALLFKLLRLCWMLMFWIWDSFCDILFRNILPSVRFEKRSIKSSVYTHHITAQKLYLWVFLVCFFLQLLYFNAVYATVPCCVLAEVLCHSLFWSHSLSWHSGITTVPSHVLQYNCCPIAWLLAWGTKCLRQFENPSSSNHYLQCTAEMEHSNLSSVLI